MQENSKGGHKATDTVRNNVLVDRHSVLVDFTHFSVNLSLLAKSRQNLTAVYVYILYTVYIPVLEIPKEIPPGDQLKSCKFTII